MIFIGYVSNIFLPPGSLSGGTVLVKQLFKLVWPKAGKKINIANNNDNAKLSQLKLGK